MNANFEKFISPAIERQEIWRVIVVGAIWMALYLLLSSLYFLAAFGLGYLENLDALREGEFNTPPLMIFLLSSFLFWILALLIPMWFFHRRGLISLLGGLSQRFFVHMGLGAAGFFIFVFLLGQLDRQEITLQENIDPTLWQIYLLPGLFLLPFVDVLHLPLYRVEMVLLHSHLFCSVSYIDSARIANKSCCEQI